MKGFIEVSTTYVNGFKKEEVLLINTDNIKFIFNKGHTAELITYDNKSINIKESYEEIKELIKKSFD